jgi:hypothetical protein
LRILFILGFRAEQEQERERIFRKRKKEKGKIQTTEKVTN